MKEKTGLPILLLLSWFCFCTSGTVRADDIVWNPGVSSGDWNNVSNWVFFNTSGAANRVPTGTDHGLLYTDNTNKTVSYNSTGPVFELLNIGAPSGIPGSPYSGTMTLNLSGGIFHTTGDQDTVGGTGRGVVIQTGGSYIVSGGIGSLVVGSESTGIGTYNLSGTGSLSTAAFQMVGGNGTGTFTQSAGINSVGTTLHVGWGAGSNGAYNLSGTGSLVVNVNEAVGSSGTGVFNQSGGSNTISGVLYIARNPGSTGTYNLTGGTLDANGGIVNNGTFLQNNGTNTSKGMFTQTGNYNLSNGALNATGGLTNNGTFNQTGGTNTTAIGTTATVGNGGTYNLGGGTFNTNGGFVNNGTVNMTIGNTTGHLILGNGTNMTNNNSFNITGQGNSGVVSNFGWASFSNTIQTNQIVVQPVSYAAPATPTTPVTGTITNAGTWTASQTNAVYGAVATNTAPTAHPSVSLDYDLKGVSFNNYGGYISDPSTSIFSNLVNETTGYLQGGAGDEFLILGDFENKSTQTGLWNTDQALLGFVGDSGSIHNYHLSGTSPSFDWGALYLAAGNSLTISSSLSQGLDFGTIYLEDISQLRQITSSTDIYYTALLDLSGNPLDPTGWSIGGQGHLINGHSVPEPSTLLFLSLGLMGLAGVRRIFHM